MKLVSFISFALLLLFSTFKINATEAAPKEVSKEVSKETPKEETVVSTHTIKINNVDIKYKATAGIQHQKDSKGVLKATLFYTSYIKEGEDKKNRPITFCFNGGPGSSSVWLHLGVFGPKRVSIDKEGLKPLANNALLDNPYSILDLTDLVFIDPVSTGYSKAVDDPKEFHGVDADVESVADFIRLYTTREERWQSPKFIAGESYGTTRAAVLASELHNKQYLYLDGIILLSTVLNFQTIDLSNGNDLAFQLLLPTYTATALYHNRLGPEKQKDPKKTQEEVEKFALGEYAQALLKGDLLSKQERDEIINKLSGFTGLSKDYLERSNLRVPIFRFAKELLKDENKVVGRFDGRIKGNFCDPCSDTIDFDPSLDIILGLFTAAYNDYVRSELKWKQDEEYKILTNLSPWNYNSGNKYLNVSDRLQEVMSKDSNLQVFVASGYTDLATPYFSTQYTLSHLNLEPALRANITSKNYTGGHMMYFYEPSLIDLKKDLTDFYKTRLSNNKAPI